MLQDQIFEEKSVQKKNLTNMNLIQKIMKGVSDKQQADEKYKLGS